jgi:hypothetical protein
MAKRKNDTDDTMMKMAEGLALLVFDRKVTLSDANKINDALSEIVALVSRVLELERLVGERRCRLRRVSSARAAVRRRPRPSSAQRCGSSSLVRRWRPRDLLRWPGRRWRRKRRAKHQPGAPGAEAVTLRASAPILLERATQCGTWIGTSKDLQASARL